MGTVSRQTYREAPQHRGTSSRVRPHETRRPPSARRARHVLDSSSSANRTVAICSSPHLLPRPPRSRGGGPPIPAPAPPGPRRDLPRPRLKLRPSGRPTDATRARIRHCRPRLIPNGVLLAYGASKLLSAMVSDAQLFLPLVLPPLGLRQPGGHRLPRRQGCRNLRARDAGQRPLPGDGVAALRAHARAPVSRRPSGAAGRRSRRRAQRRRSGFRRRRRGRPRARRRLSRSSSPRLSPSPSPPSPSASFGTLRSRRASRRSRSTAS
ncbi:hypothetical protein ACH61_02414 [Rathayibacter tanaceti]|uniref:Uncharacterized protein n=1 Tax=Rathayibacter tanaceti TaxID=1671680 RepID=A0A162F8G6_9MICO|nr:hypothetical protein ACH61_02414 [Rathayibacter tanaceti]